jgi:hypothetical protein
MHEIEELLKRKASIQDLQSVFGAIDNKLDIAQF